MSSQNKYEKSLENLLKDIKKQFDLEEDFIFDYCISNPPYQITKKDTSDKSIYHDFINLGRNIAKESIMITPARFLFNTGNTPTEWNEKILNDKEFKVLYFEPKSTNIFPTADIKGGVCITRCKKGYQNGGYNGLYIHFEELKSIKQKVQQKKEKTIDEICFSTTKFNLEELLVDHPEYIEIIGSQGKEKRMTSNIFSLLSEIFVDQDQKDRIGIWGLENKDEISDAKSRKIKYIEKKYVDTKEQKSNLNKWKVIVPASNGSGSLGEVLSTPMIGTPMIGTPMIGNTQTFISFGAFEDKEEASNCLKYIKTKFSRAILGIKKVTQSNKKEVWKFVPIQNFTSKSDITETKKFMKLTNNFIKNTNYQIKKFFS